MAIILKNEIKSITRWLDKITEDETKDKQHYTLLRMEGEEKLILMKT